VTEDSRLETSAKTFGLLARFVHRAGQAAAAELRRHGLTPAQFQLLLAVQRRPAATQRELASYGPVRGRRSVDVLAVATLALVSAVSTAAVRSRGPGSTTATAYGATVLWALAGIVDGQRRRSRPATFAAIAGAGPLLAALRRSRT
jgi:hypothetical protein